MRTCTLPRRRVLVLALAAASATASVRAASAYPARAIRLVVPFPPGGSADSMARVVASALSDRLGQPMVVENRPGAGGNLGTDAVAKAPADGYTLLLASSSSMAVSPALYLKLPYDPQRDFSFIGQIASFQGVLCVAPTQPHASLRDLVIAAKSHPGRLSYGSPGSGTTPNLAAELLKKMASIDITHIPYRGDAPAISDAMGGQVPMVFVNVAPAIAGIRAGRLRPLAVSGAMRSPELPTVPTIAESGYPGFAVVGWAGLAAPAGTPAAVVGRLSDQLKLVLENPEVIDKLAHQSAEATYSTPAAFSQYARAERLRFSRLVKEARIALD